MRSNKSWLVAVLLFRSGEAYAQSSEGRQLLRFREEIGLPGDLQLTAPSDTVSLKFAWPESWQPRVGSVLRIMLEHSPELDGDRSFLSVTVNHGILRSVRLDSSNAQSSEITIALPPASIQQHNEITLSVKQWVKPGRGGAWTKISAKSVLDILYSAKPDPAALAALPSSFLGPNPYSMANLAVLAPNKPSSAALEAAALLVAWLTLRARPQRVQVRVLDNVDVAGRDPLLIAGTPGEQPEIAKVLADSPITLRGATLAVWDEKLPAAEGVILLGNARKGGSRPLVVTGNSPEGVLRAARHISTGGRLHGGVVRVREDRTVSVVPRDWKNALPPRNTFSLSEMEPEEIPISSIGPTVLELNPTPDAQFLPFGHKATLKLRLNPAHYQPRSVISVELNGAVVARSEVESISEGRANLRFAIPPGLLGRVNRLTIAWGPGNPAESRHGTVAWLSRESSFYLPRDYSVKIPDLALLRHRLFPFSLLADYSDVVVAVPDPLSRSLFPALAELAAVLGRESPGERVSFRVQRISEITEGTAARSHLIALHVDGTENPLAAAQAQGKRIPRPREFEGAPTIRQSLSPWNRDKCILMVSASSPSAVQHAVRQVFQPPLVDELRYDAAYIAGNRVQCFQLTEQRDLRQSSLALKLEALLLTYWFSLPVVLTMASALLFIGLRLVLRHYRRKDQPAHVS